MKIIMSNNSQIFTKFSIGEQVYLKTDLDQVERFITGITIRQGSIQYALAFDETESWHYDFEIDTDKDIMKVTTN